MRDLILEKGAFGANPSARDLARHLFTRMLCGKAVIVAENPSGLLPALRRQWLKLARKVQKERACTLNAERIAELTLMVQRMQTLRFAAKWPDEGSVDVYIVTIEQLLRWAPECRTLYITSQVEDAELYIITALLPRNALVVLFET